MIKTTIPNIITALRFFLIPFIFYFILTKKFLPALILFLIATISDKLDGYMARKLKQKSRTGAAFDALTDSLLLFSVIVALYAAGSIPLIFFVLLILPRPITFILLGFFNRKKFMATNYSRYAAALTYILIILFLINAGNTIAIPLIIIVYILTFIHWLKLAGFR